MSSSSRLQSEATEEFDSDSFWMDNLSISAFGECSPLLFGDVTATLDNSPPLSIDHFPPSFGNDHPLSPRDFEYFNSIEATNEYNVPFSIQPEDLYVIFCLCLESSTMADCAPIPHCVVLAPCIKPLMLNCITNTTPVRQRKQWGRMESSNQPQSNTTSPRSHTHFQSQTQRPHRSILRPQ